MSVLIKGMDFLPKSGVTLEVYKAENGETYIRESGMMGWSMKLVALPEKHGRLIDADEAMKVLERGAEKAIKENDCDRAYNIGFATGFISKELTVIEAEGE